VINLGVVPLMLLSLLHFHEDTLLLRFDFVSPKFKCQNPMQSITKSFYIKILYGSDTPGRLCEILKRWAAGVSPYSTDQGERAGHAYKQSRLGYFCRYFSSLAFLFIKKRHGMTARQRFVICQRRRCRRFPGQKF
jgi:hypothetical protein